MIKKSKLVSISLLALLLLLSACTGSDSTKKDGENQASKENKENNETEIAGDLDYQEFSDGETTFGVVENPGDGPAISFSLSSGINILTEEVDGETYYFKDLNNNGELDTFEDWREDTETRATALAEALTVD